VADPGFEVGEICHISWEHKWIWNEKEKLKFCFNFEINYEQNVNGQFIFFFNQMGMMSEMPRSVLATAWRMN